MAKRQRNAGSPAVEKVETKHLVPLVCTEYEPHALVLREAVATGKVAGHEFEIMMGIGGPLIVVIDERQFIFHMGKLVEGLYKAVFDPDYRETIKG